MNKQMIMWVTILVLVGLVAHVIFHLVFPC